MLYPHLELKTFCRGAT